MSGSIKRIVDLLNSFNTSCMSRLSTLKEKLTSLERKVDYLEARVNQGGQIQYDSLIMEQNHLWIFQVKLF